MRHTINLVKKQRGLSLIELLIAVSIGLFLISGIATSYIASIKSSSNRSQHSMLEDNARIAIETLTKTLEHTGYATISNPPLVNRIVKNASAITATCSTNTNNNTGEKKTQDGATDSDGSTAPDAITNLYLGDEKYFIDCMGSQLPAAPTNCRMNNGLGDPDDAVIHNGFFVQNNSLMCAGSRTANTEIVAEGVENIQFLYGVDVDDDRKVDRYLNATQLFSGTGFQDNVLTIQVAVLVHSLLPVKTTAESKTYSLLDATYKSPKDRKQREVFTATINLRNTL